MWQYFNAIFAIRDLLHYGWNKRMISIVPIGLPTFLMTVGSFLALNFVSQTLVFAYIDYLFTYQHFAWCSGLLVYYNRALQHFLFCSIQNKTKRLKMVFGRELCESSHQPYEESLQKKWRVWTAQTTENQEYCNGCFVSTLSSLEKQYVST